MRALGPVDLGERVERRRVCCVLPIAAGAAGLEWAMPEPNGVINQTTPCLPSDDRRALSLILTRGRHPVHRCSFAAQGGTSPAPAVAGSHGAAFAAELLALTRPAWLPCGWSPLEPA
jgi:hypothetical protein